MSVSKTARNNYGDHLYRYPPIACIPGEPPPLLPHITCPEELLVKALGDAFSGLTETIPVRADSCHTDPRHTD